MLKILETGRKAVASIEENNEIMALVKQVDSNEGQNSDKDSNPFSAFLIQHLCSAAEVETKLKNRYGIELRDLPVLTSKNESKVPAHFIAWLLISYEEESIYNSLSFAVHKKPGLCAEAITAASMVDRDGLQKFLLKIADMYLAKSEKSKKKNLAYPICRYADESTMAILTRRAQNWVTSASRINASPLYEFRMATLFNDTRSAVLFADKMGDLDKYAELRGTDAQTLRDTVLVEFGLDETGRKVYDLGADTLTVKLTQELDLELFDDASEKTVKSVPKRNADPEKYEAAKADLSEIKKAVKKIAKLRYQQLFVAFLDGSGFNAASWQTAYTKNPVLNRIGRLIVWSQGKKAFTLKDNTVIDSSEKPYVLTDEPIKVAHPMEMDAADVTAWQKYFTRHGMKQPFQQIWEPVHSEKEIKKDRYFGCMIPYYRFLRQEKHGITVTDADFHNEIDIDFKDCSVDIERVDWRRHEIRMEDCFEVTDFRFKQYTRQVNHIVAYLDRITVWDRVRKDDLSVMDMIPGFTLAQITEFIAAAQEANATNVLAALLDYKNANFADFDPMDEFTLEW